jgi:hypothetical protein
MFRIDSVSYLDVILIVSVMKIAKPKWLGHLARMEDNTPCRKTTLSQPESSRKKGRSERGWPDSMLKDLRTLDSMAEEATG